MKIFEPTQFKELLMALIFNNNNIYNKNNSNNNNNNNNNDVKLSMWMREIDLENSYKKKKKLRATQKKGHNDNNIVKWYMKCFMYWTADLKSSKLWSSQLWAQFKQLRIEDSNCV